MLLQEEFKRYKRQIMLDGWGDTAQERLKQSVVLVAGAGGLGSPVAIYLAAAGVGTIMICDYDRVEITNLNRQIMHDYTRVGSPKAFSAQLCITTVNEYVRVIPITEKITPENVSQIVDGAEIIVDCMDNFSARYSLMRAALQKNIPFIHGSVWGMEGRLTFIQTPETPCLRCIFPEAPPQDVNPVVGATAGVIGSFQALEAIKYLTGIGSNLRGQLLVWDGSCMEFKKLRTVKDPACPLCGKGVSAILGEEDVVYDRGALEER